jgi:hypothetical protein
MLITRTSQISGITRTKDIPVTQQQLQAWLTGAKIQNVMPNLPKEDREFIMTGITQEEWDEAFKEEE